MYSCGYTVQTIWVSGFINCWSLSTKIPHLVAQAHPAYGKFLVTRNLTQNNPLTFTQVKTVIFNLLKHVFSTQFTTPIITTEKRT